MCGEQNCDHICLPYTDTREEHCFVRQAEKKVFVFTYDGKTCALARRIDGDVAFDIVLGNNVLYTKTSAQKNRHSADDIIMATFELGSRADFASDVQEGSLLQFHQRLHVWRLTPLSA